MKAKLWVIGNTSFPYLKEGTGIYEKRLKHYLPFEYNTIADVKNAKNLSKEQLKNKEGAQILKKLDKGDFLILMDERGKEYSSVKFASYIDNLLQQSSKRLTAKEIWAESIEWKAGTNYTTLQVMRESW